MRFATKLAWFLAVTLTCVQLGAGGALYWLIRGTLIDEGKAQLTTAAGLFVRQLDEIEAQIAGGVRLLTLDFALRQAIAAHDHETLSSALRNHGRRVGAARMLLVDVDGTIGADTQAMPPRSAAPFAYRALLDQAAEGDAQARVVVIDGVAAWLVVVPVLAPDPVAFIAAILPLDDALLTRLRVLAGLPDATGLAIATPSGGWRHAAGPVAGLLRDDMARPDTALAHQPRILATANGEMIFLMAKLATASGSPAVAAVMGYPLSEALWRYRPLGVALLVVLAGGLAVAMVGAALIARGVARPIELLAAATKRIEAGDYTPPNLLARDDEIGQLSAALRRMTSAISEREARIRHQATHEPVTGLPNRLALKVLIDAALHGQPAVVLVIALARLQEIANTVGRDIANRVMYDAAARLTALLDHAALAPVLLGSIGEQSFAALLPGAGTAAGTAWVTRILAEFERPYRENELAIDAGIVIGMAMSPEHGMAATDLLRRAEVAQHMALRARSRFSTYDAATDPHRAELLSLMSDLRRGIAQGELELHFQPKLDLRSRRITGAEALVRWNHPTQGRLAPDFFIHLAEETGNIGALTRWALDTGLAQAAQWRRGGLDVRISINLSVRDLDDTTLPDWLAGMLARHQLAAGALTLEITESAIMGEPDAAIAVLERLAGQGIALSIDDFGTGQSSLTYLRRLPVRELKIDKAFVLKLAECPDDQTIVRTVIELGHGLGYSVTAEGVEDAASLAVLGDFNCDHAQGFFIARPMPSAVFASFVETWNARRGAPCGS